MSSLILTQTLTVDAATGTATLSVTDYASGTAAGVVVAARDSLGPVVGQAGALGTLTPFLGFVAQTAQGCGGRGRASRCLLSERACEPVSLRRRPACRQYAQHWVGDVAYSRLQQCEPPLIGLPRGAYASNDDAGPEFL